MAAHPTRGASHGATIGAVSTEDANGLLGTVGWDCMSEDTSDAARAAEATGLGPDGDTEAAFTAEADATCGE